MVQDFEHVGGASSVTNDSPLTLLAEKMVLGGTEFTTLPGYFGRIRMWNRILTAEDALMLSNPET